MREKEKRENHEGREKMKTGKENVGKDRRDIKGAKQEREEQTEEGVSYDGEKDEE